LWREEEEKTFETQKSQETIPNFFWGEGLGRMIQTSC
jgi:hypothetical protein